MAQASSLPDLTDLCVGSDESPETSTTLLVELPGWSGGLATQWSGPGLAAPRSLRLAGLTADFWDQWRDNQARFPSGVDVFFICGSQVIGLPRTTLVQTREAG